MWPFHVPYRQYPVDKLEAEYDFIVAGGGTAGCALARRLSESGKHTVLLIEKGDAADSWLNKTPLTSHHFAAPDKKHSNVFNSAVDPAFGRSFPLICGVGLGGTTRINGAQHTLGCPAEYDAWGQEGRPGWSYNELKPYFTKSENWIGATTKEGWHGSGGPLTVRPFADFFFGCAKVAAQAASDIGFKPIADMHSPLQPYIGWNKMQYILGADGSRQSSFRTYLPKDFVNATRNLHICTNAITARLQFSKHVGGASLRADSVEIQSTDGNLTRVVAAKREIVLACGAFGSPQVLLLSGIGPEEHLKNMGIEIIRQSPGVGANLQDHVFVRTVYNCPLQDSFALVVKQPWLMLRELFKYLFYGTGWFLCTPVEVEIFGKASHIGPDGKPTAASAQDQDPSSPHNRPDFAVMTVPMAEPDTPGIDPSKGLFGQTIGIMKAESRGQVTLRSRNPTDNPVCEMRYLSHPDDWHTLRTAMRVSAQLCRQMQANGYPLEAAMVPSALDDETLDAYIRERVETMTHYASSCRMAPESDEFPGVVDPSLRVHGIPNLRIADASVLPNSPAVHPQALIYAVAEKCADMMLRQYSEL
ncbi:FAD/NAD-P-binding domain-containing protein [Favolaschia claudopus]|uniref:FAD/NAD-P-binding domain-containing protein n=1 Tax=Favolaschia claudopus TaxID=2862362 RepID=A0AAW0DUF3_9AGAR